MRTTTSNTYSANIQHKKQENTKLNKLKKQWGRNACHGKSTAFNQEI